MKTEQRNPLNCFKKEGGIKEKDGGGKSRYIINTYMTITVYPLYNYNMLIIKIKKHTKAKIK
jgi:hypothetical protein